MINWKEKFENYYANQDLNDGSHSIGHFRRVYKIALEIANDFPDANTLVLLAGAYFHDLVNLPKDHPERSFASRYSAEKAETLLEEWGFPQELITNTKHVIEAHSFSANIETKTIEAKILQDADRIEALGYIGIARCFYVSGSLSRHLFHDADPFAEKRELNDQAYAMDHFVEKLFKLPATMKTEAGKRIADKRVQVMRNFYDELGKEVLGN